MGLSADLSWRYCCTCDFWGGERTQSDDGDRVECESRTLPGGCTGGSWDWAGQPRTALSTCTGWKQWEVMEKVG